MVVLRGLKTCVFFLLRSHRHTQTHTDTSREPYKSYSLTMPSPLPLITLDASYVDGLKKKKWDRWDSLEEAKKLIVVADNAGHKRVNGERQDALDMNAVTAEVVALWLEAADVVSRQLGEKFRTQKTGTC